MEKMENEDTTDQVINDLERSIERISSMGRAAKTIIRTMAMYIRDGGEIPRDLALSICGYMVDYADKNDKVDDEDIQLLLDGCEKMLWGSRS